ncbi:MAG TPA: hypothetical protein PLP23_09225 [Panacibacter sp.]|nr:hypothetical protein [Panacibacter sp.]
MSKWDKLNQEFDKVLNELSNDEWVKWNNETTHVNNVISPELIERALAQEAKISLPIWGFSDTLTHYEFDDYFRQVLNISKKSLENFGAFLFLGILDDGRKFTTCPISTY